MNFRNNAGHFLVLFERLTYLLFSDFGRDIGDFVVAQVELLQICGFPPVVANLEFFKVYNFLWEYSQPTALEIQRSVLLCSCQGGSQTAP